MRVDPNCSNRWRTTRVKNRNADNLTIKLIQKNARMRKNNIDSKDQLNAKV